MSVEGNCSADPASRCQAIVFSRLGTRFRGYADMIARMRLSPHETFTAGIRTEWSSSRLSTSIGLTIIMSSLCACLWSYTYMIARKCLTPNKTRTTSVVGHRTLLLSSTRSVRSCASRTLAVERVPRIYATGSVSAALLREPPFSYRCLRKSMMTSTDEFRMNLGETSNFFRMSLHSEGTGPLDELPRTP